MVLGFSCNSRREKSLSSTKNYLLWTHIIHSINLTFSDSIPNSGLLENL